MGDSDTVQFRQAVLDHVRDNPRSMINGYSLRAHSSMITPLRGWTGSTHHAWLAGMERLKARSIDDNVVSSDCAFAAAAASKLGCTIIIITVTDQHGMIEHRFAGGPGCLHIGYVDACHYLPFIAAAPAVAPTQATQPAEVPAAEDDDGQSWARSVRRRISQTPAPATAAPSFEPPANRSPASVSAPAPPAPFPTPPAIPATANATNIATAAAASSSPPAVSAAPNAKRRSHRLSSDTHHRTSLLPVLLFDESKLPWLELLVTKKRQIAAYLTSQQPLPSGLQTGTHVLCESHARRAVFKIALVTHASSFGDAYRVPTGPSFSHART